MRRVVARSLLGYSACVVLSISIAGLEMSAVLETHGVTVRELRALRQHNLYAYMPVLRAIVDIGAYIERGSDQFPELAERLTKFLPGLQSHECSLGRPGGFLERLKR